MPVAKLSGVVRPSGSSAGAATELRGRLDEEAVHRRTGCVLHSSYLPAKLLWLSREDPDAFRRRFLGGAGDGAVDGVGAQAADEDQDGGHGISWGGVRAEQNGL